MKKFRDKIKRPLIAAAEISPIEYENLRGPQSHDYIQDQADGIINRIAGDILNDKPQIMHTFWLLYSCKSYEITRQELSKPDQEGKPTLICTETVLKYSRTGNKTVRDFIEENDLERNRIIEAIRNQYDSAKSNRS